MLTKPKRRAEFIRAICTKPALRWTGKILGRRAEAWWIEWRDGHSRIGWKVWGKGKRLPQEGETAGNTSLAIEAMEAQALQFERDEMKKTTSKKTSKTTPAAGKKSTSTLLKGMRAEAAMGAAMKKDLAKKAKSKPPVKKAAPKAAAKTSKREDAERVASHLEAPDPGPGMLGRGPQTVAVGKLKDAPFGASPIFGDVRTVRAGSKQEQAIALMKRPEGAGLKELMATFEWQRHTVRGFIAGAVQKKLGYAVASTKNGDDRVYRITSELPLAAPAEPEAGKAVAE
jgi:hypothetical protein